MDNVVVFPRKITPPPAQNLTGPHYQPRRESHNSRDNLDDFFLMLSGGLLFTLLNKIGALLYILF